MKKNMKIETEEQKEMKRFVLVLLGVVVVVIGIYFFTRAFVTKDLFKDEKNDQTYTTGVVSETAAIVGNMLTRPENEYYVALFSLEDNQASYYDAIISKYSGDSENKNKLKVYYVDLANKLNEKYLATEDDKATTKYKDLDSLRLGDFTLIKVKKGKVNKLLTTVEDIKKELSND